MGYNVKRGKGGYGLEVYDEEGKYAQDFSFQINGQEIKGYDDFRSLYFDSLAQDSAGQFNVPMLEQLYQTVPDFQAEVDANLYEEYNRMLTEAVNEHNARQVWDTPEECAKNLHELFVPNLVNNMLDNDILNSNASQVAKFYKVSTFAACLQMSRYKTNRANLISEQEYLNRLSSEKADGYVSSSGDEEELHEYIKNAIAGQKSIPILRNISGISASDRAEVMASFYDENSARHSCLSHYDRTQCSYLGSVVYFSTGDFSYGGRYNTTSITGLVKMSDKLKLLECPLDNWSSNESSCNRAIPEVIRFRNEIRNDPDFNKRLIEKFTESGRVNDKEAENIVLRFRQEIERDPGLCAIIMGYDAIYGISYQFDLLNLGIADIIK